MWAVGFVLLFLLMVGIIKMGQNMDDNDKRGYS